MLKFFNRLEKTRNFVLLVFAVLMVGSLVFFYTPARNTYTINLTNSSETAASVSGQKITVGEIMRQKENYARFARGQSFPASMMIEGLIGSRISRLEAQKLGLTATDKEVADEIRRQNKTEDGKPFDQARYEINVIDQFGSIAAYEQNVRDDLSAKKLEAFITSGITVSEDEILNDFQRKNTKFDLSYVAVSTTDLAKTITPTDQQLHDYFEKNKSSYYISVPQKKIKYVFINTAKLGEKLQIKDEDLKSVWDSMAPDKKTSGVLGQEIVLRVSKPDLDSQVQGKANDLVKQLRAGGPTVTEEAFATLAKGHSENPATAPEGGKLKGPVRENTAKPDDPYQRLLKMKPGEISEPISYQSRYFILRRGDTVPKTFEEAKKELDVSVRNQKAYAASAELAQKVADSLKQTKDPQKTAQEFASAANMSVADMIKETSYIKPGDDVPNIGVAPQFEEGIASLENPNDVGDKTPIQNGFAIPLLVDKKDPRDADFDEVKSQIVDVVKVESARSQVEDIAKAIAAGAGSLDKLGAAATAKGMSAKEQKNFILGSPLGDGPTAATSEALEDAVFALKQGEVTKVPLKVGDNWYVVGVTKREDANIADFSKQHDSLRETMLSKKRGDTFGDYIAAVKQKYQDNGYIKVYKEVIEKIDAPPAGLPGETE